MKKKIYSVAKILFFIGFGIFCIFWFLGKMSPNEKTELLESFRSANYFWVVVAFLLEIIAHILRALRWKQLLDPMGYNPKFKTTFSAVMVGYLANLAIPRLGEVLRCSLLNKSEKIPVQKSLGTVVSERIVDIFVFGLIVLLTLWIEFDILKEYLYSKFSDKLNFSSIGNAAILALVFFIVVCLTFFFLRKKLLQIKLIAKIWNIVTGFWEGIKSIFKLKNPLLFIVYSIGIWLFYFLSIYVLFFCFAETNSLSLNAALIALVLGSLGVMVTPGGIGLYPLLVAESLVIYNITMVTGYAIGWLAWVSQQAGVIIIGMAALIASSLPSFKKKNNI